MAGESVFHFKREIFHHKTSVDRPTGKVNKLVSEDSKGIGLVTTVALASYSAVHFCLQ